jgi:hypothetical protein
MAYLPFGVESSGTKFALPARKSSFKRHKGCVTEVYVAELQSL